MSTSVLIPWGGGGLACGIAAAIRASGRSCRIYACEVEHAAPLTRRSPQGIPSRYALRALVRRRHREPARSCPGCSTLARELLDGALVASVDEVEAAVADALPEQPRRRRRRRSVPGRGRAQRTRRRAVDRVRRLGRQYRSQRRCSRSSRDIRRPAMLYLSRLTSNGSSSLRHARRTRDRIPCVLDRRCVGAAEDRCACARRSASARCPPGSAGGGLALKAVTRLPRQRRARAADRTRV